MRYTEIIWDYGCNSKGISPTTKGVISNTTNSLKEKITGTCTEKSSRCKLKNGAKLDTGSLWYEPSKSAKEGVQSCLE